MIDAFVYTLESLSIDALILSTINNTNPLLCSTININLQSFTQFTGSNAIFYVTKKKIKIFTDGRYISQAQKQLQTSLSDSRFEIHDLSYNNLVSFITEDIKNSKQLFKISFDFNSISANMYLMIKKIDSKVVLIHKEIQKIYKIFKRNISTDSDFNAINLDKSSFKDEHILDEHILLLKLGINSKQALQSLLKNKIKNKYNLAIISCPFSISWLLNLRNFLKNFTNTSYNTSINALLVLQTIESEKHILFTDIKFDLEIQKHLLNLDIEVQTTNKIDEFIKTKTANNITNSNDPSIKIICDYNSLPASIYEKLNENNCKIISLHNIVEDLQSVKNDLEISGFINAHIYDGLALTKFLIFLEDNKNYTQFNLNEYNLSEILFEFRKKSDHFIGNSFDSIIGYQKNSSIIHYKPNNKSSINILYDEFNTILLIDSGGHYLSNIKNLLKLNDASSDKSLKKEINTNIQGTTDVTRSVCLFKNPTQKQKEYFTLILKSHILLSSYIFTEGTTGANLDKIGRYYINKNLLDFEHSVGHGVGNILNVHEGPHSISKSSTYPLSSGMIVSIEPGIYLKEEYGIRIENLYVIKKHPKNEKFLFFEALTLVPIDISLIDFSMLNFEEYEWLLNYHKKISFTFKINNANDDIIDYIENICNNIEIHFKDLFGEKTCKI